MSDWQDISTYPRCKKCNDPNCDWGPEVVVLCPPTKTHIVLNEAPQPEFETDISIYVAHLEAGEWLTRCAEGPIAWAALHAKPTHWAPLPSHDERCMNWQPIESAPRDGTSILCACQFWPGGTWIYLVLAFDDDPALPTHPWATLDGPSYAEDVPKLWQPIPEPPEAE